MRKWDALQRWLAGSLATLIVIAATLVVIAIRLRDTTGAATPPPGFAAPQDEVAAATPAVTAPRDPNELPAIAVPERAGMTWGLAATPAGHDDLVALGCHGKPATASGGCDAYSGDTSCSAVRPLLCIDVDDRPPPPGLEARPFSSLWAYGRVALAPPVRGDTLTSRASADAWCATHLGEHWRMAEHHDGGRGSGGWGLLAAGRVEINDRFWVAINDQRANCWNVAPPAPATTECGAPNVRCAKPAW